MHLFSSQTVNHVCVLKSKLSNNNAILSEYNRTDHITVSLLAVHSTILSFGWHLVVIEGKGCGVLVCTGVYWCVLVVLQARHVASSRPDQTLILPFLLCLPLVSMYSPCCVSEHFSLF